MPSLTLLRAPLLALALLAVLASLLAAPASATTEPDPSDVSAPASEPASEPGSPAEDPADGPAEPAPEEEAERALEHVESLFEESEGPAESTESAEPEEGDATLALRDLALRLNDLDAADRATASRYFGRPTAANDPLDPYGANPETRICSAVVCVHYVLAGKERTTAAYAQQTLAIATSVHNRYVAAGYKAPKADAGRGGNNLTDVYIAEIGDRGLYGYCPTDERRPNKAPWDRWAYCVVDNDYRSSQFPSNTPLENLQVTVAHEYFHAVQYAYDFAEDGWFIEATATWVEDEMYDAVDDNRQYLAASPLRQPRRSMDRFDPQTGYHYGIWIFFRYLSERFPATKGGLPTVVRDMWRRADGTRAPRLNRYSWQAVSGVARARGMTPVRAFTLFSAANRRPRQAYTEGAAYRAARLSGGFRVARKPVSRKVRLNHLSSATYRLVPTSALRGPRWRLRLTVDMAPAYRGSGAVVRVHYKNGTQRVAVLRLNKQGNARRAVAFSSSRIALVELTLANASGRFACWQSSDFSCQGSSRDDRLLQQFSARPVR